MLAIIYKLFTKIITHSIEKKLDENLRRQHADVRRTYSITDHIHTINQLKDKYRKYNMPIDVVFVDYEKAFE